MLKNMQTNDLIIKQDIIWNLSAAFSHDELLLYFLDLLSQLSLKPKIIVHGSPNFFWDARKTPFHFNKKEIDVICSKYAERSIPLYLIASRQFMKTENFQDKIGNYLLAKLSETKNNGVILSNDDFSKYVHDKYPNLKQTCSIRKSYLFKGIRDAQYYEYLAEKYDKVVVHVEDNFNFPLLKKLSQKNKYEILISEPCMSGCKKRRIHNRIEEISYLMLGGEFSKKNFFSDCHNANILNIHVGEGNHQRIREGSLTLKELNYLYNLGFRLYKITGREEICYTFIFHLCRYMLSPKLAPLVFKTMSMKFHMDKS